MLVITLYCAAIAFLVFCSDVTVNGEEKTGNNEYYYVKPLPVEDYEPIRYDSVEITTSELVMNDLRITWKLHPVLNFSDDLELFHKYVNSEVERHYWMVVLFTNQAEDESTAWFYSMAKSHWQYLDMRRNVSHADLFFGHLCLQTPKSSAIFKTYQVKKVPSILLFGKNAPKNELPIPFPVNEVGGGFGVLNLAKWLEDETAIHDLKISTTSFVEQFASGANVDDWLNSDSGSRFMRFTIVGQLTFLLLWNVKLLYSKKGQMMLTGFVYFISVSGTMFSILRGVPPLGYSAQHGGLFFIYPDRGQQFMLEGFMVAFVFYAFSITLFVASELVLERRIKSETLDVDINPRDTSTYNKYAMVFLFMTLVCFQLTLYMFRKKAAWYPM